MISTVDHMISHVNHVIRTVEGEMRRRWRRRDVESARRAEGVRCRPPSLRGKQKIPYSKLLIWFVGIIIITMCIYN